MGGAYHPALGELVRSRMMLDNASALLSGVKPNSSVVLGVNKADVSKMIGQHRCNINALCDRFKLKSLKIVQADVKNGEITVISLD